MQFLRQVLVQDDSVTVSTQRTDDLPVNPLSAIFFTIKFLNDTGTLANYSLISALLAQVSKVEVLYQGSAVISGSLADLARVNGFLLGRPPLQGRAPVTNNDIRWITVPLLLGRRPYWAKECFPAVRRGELQLQTTFAAAQTGVDTPVLQVETLELLEAKPTQYLKYTTISKTPTATGDHDVDLPIGNRLAGVVGFSTTPPSGTSFNASLGQMRLLLDNVEGWYAKTNFESLQGSNAMRVNDSPLTAVHSHLENTGALYTQNAETGGNHPTASFWDQYVFLDLDPLHDDQWLVDTKGRARVHLRINQEPTADAIRLLPLELVSVG